MGDGALIGIGAIVLDGARVGEEALVGAGALVTPESEVPARTLVVGTPARAVRRVDGFREPASPARSRVMIAGDEAEPTPAQHPFGDLEHRQHRR